MVNSMKKIQKDLKSFQNGSNVKKVKKLEGEPPRKKRKK